MENIPGSSKLNIYCDESSYTNPFSRYFLIGALYLPRENKAEIHSNIKRIRRKFGFMPELKWQNVTQAKMPYLKELIDYFFESEMQFRTIIVNKSILHLDKPGVVDELPFYKFYYLLLKGIFAPKNGYYIFVDERNRKNKESYGKLIFFLKSYLQKEGSNLHSFQEIKSDQQIIMQLLDLLMGAVGYDWNGFKSSHPKVELVKYIAEKNGQKNLQYSSRLHDKKWNQFVWKPAK